MFRDFSFAPASPPSYSAYEADRAAMNVSPTSKPDAHRPHYLARPPTPPCTIGDLASQLNQQSLRIDTRSDARCSGPLTPPSDDDSATEPAHSAPRPTYSRVSASLLRMQRQSNARLQCSSSHVRDISRLVQMIQEEEQCTIKDAISRSSSTSTLCSTTTSSSDEGIDMDYNPSAPSCSSMYGVPPWKAGDLRDGFTRVAKPVRMRRRSGNKVEKRRSS